MPRPEDSSTKHRKRCAPNRNGGRHCCQPPLRRAKDLPVFDLPWSRPVNGLRPRFSILAHQLRRRFSPNSSLLRGARSTYSTARPEGSLVVRPIRPGIWNARSLEAKTTQFSAALLGSTTLASRFAHRRSEDRQEPRRARGRSTLPAPLPGWPRKEPKLFPLPAGGDRTFGHLPRSSCPCGPSEEAGTAVPITPAQCTPAPSRGSEK